MHINTTAGEVHKELEKLGIYPWQYQDYKLISVNYNVVLSDIETYWNTEARFREGFKVDEEKKEIYVPNFFTKVNGIHHKMDDYKKFVLMLKDAKNTVVMDKEPFLVNGYYEFNVSPKNINGKRICSTMEDAKKRDKDEDFCELSIKNLLKGKFFIYKTEHCHFDELTSAKQKTVLALIQKVIEEKKFEWNEEEMVRFIVCCLNLPESVVITLNNFDYSFDVPKILYIASKMSEETAMSLWILNELGFDILLLEPSGKNTIERYFDINELSLGYFVPNVEFSNIKTEEERKQETEKIKAKKEKEKKEKREKRRENFFDAICTIFTIIAEHFWETLWYIFAIAFPIVAIILWINASGMTMLVVCFIYGCILVVSGLVLEEAGEFESDSCGGFLIAAIVIVIAMLCIRGLYYVVTDPEINKTTHTHDGFFDIEEPAEVGNNGFIIHYRKDAVGQDGYHNAYLYIENNAENTTDMYIVMKYKNKVMYESGRIEPLEYMPKMGFNSDIELPIGEHELQIEFYRYDNEADSEAKYTNELLGTGTITLHILDSSKEVKSYKEENGMNEYCSD